MRLIHEGLALQLVPELAKLVDINARSESEGMRNRLGRWASSARRRITQTRADRTVHGLLEGDAEFPGPLFQESRQVVIERQSGSHASYHG
jgi:hypothetical protein